MKTEKQKTPSANRRNGSDKAQTSRSDASGKMKTVTTARSLGSSPSGKTGKNSRSGVKNKTRSAANKRNIERVNKKQQRKNADLPTPHDNAKKNSGRPRSDAFVHQFIPFILIIAAIFITACFVCVGISPSTDNALGPVGYGICMVIYGLFGSAAFAIPVAMLGFAVFWRKLVDRNKLLIKFVLTTLTVILLGAIIHVCSGDAKYGADIGGLFSRGVQLRGGGIIGGALGYILALSIRLLGTLLVGIPALIALIMLITEITPVRVARVCREKYMAYRAETKRRRAENPKPAKSKPRHASVRDYDYDDDADADIAPKNTSHSKDHSYSDGYDSDGIRVVTGNNGIYEDIRDRASQSSHESENVERGFDADTSSRNADRSEARSKDKEKEKEKRRRQEKFLTDDVAYTGMSDEISYDDITDVEKDSTVDFNTYKGAEDNIESDTDQDCDPDNYYETADDIFPRSTLSPVRRSKNAADEVFASDKLSDVDAEPENESADTEEKAENISADSATVDAETAEESDTPVYRFPPIELMAENQAIGEGDTVRYERNKLRLKEVLESFKIRVKDINYSHGPTITRYEVMPESGVRVRSISNLVDDIALGLAVSGVRIEAPIPGKPAVGIEVPNEASSTVYLRGLIESPKFSSAKSKLNVALGADVTGNPLFLDIEKMPHLLIAGATGMGKSVCINSIIVSLLYKATPDEVKLIMIDPKKVEFSVYKDIPHLYCPIVSDPKKAAGALASAVGEMERRFELIEEVGVRNITHYNMMIANDPDRERMPQMVIIIDELADLMMTAPDDVETAICRLTQKARAAGIHLIIGTQRPSVDVVTGLIKSNIPSRIAFTVASQVDSRTIIDIAGAEKLIGRGDMLYAPVGAPKPMRAQGAFISESEVEKIVDYIKANNSGAVYNEEFAKNIDIEAAKCGEKKGSSSFGGADSSDISGADPKLQAAIDIAIETGKIATSLLQRRLEIGYGRAAKIIDQMEEMGIVSASDGNKPRKVLVTKQDIIEKRVSGTGSEGYENYDSYDNDNYTAGGADEL